MNFFFLFEVLILLDITPDQTMLNEGIAREVVNRIQKLRKKVTTDLISRHLQYGGIPRFSVKGMRQSFVVKFALVYHNEESSNFSRVRIQSLQSVSL